MRRAHDDVRGGRSERVRVRQSGAARPEKLEDIVFVVHYVLAPLP